MPLNEGKLLRSQFDQLNDRLGEQGLQAQHAREELQTAVKQATGSIQMDNANVGAELERLRTDVGQVLGTLEENSRAIAEIRKDLDIIRKDPSFQAKQQIAQVQGNPSELFGLARKQLTSTDIHRGRQTMRTFITSYPSDAKVPEAHLLIGDSYYRESKFAPAIQSYRVIIDQYKRSSLQPTALYKIGMSFYQMKFCSDAETFLKILTKSHSSFSEIDEAQRTLTLIKKYRRNKRVCMS